MIRAELTSAGRHLYRSQKSIDQLNRFEGTTTMNISANNYGNQTIGNQAIGSQVNSMNAEMTVEATVNDVVRALEEFRRSVQAADVSEADKEDLTDEASRILEKLPRKGVQWALQCIHLLASEAISVIGQEGAAVLLDLFPHN